MTPKACLCGRVNCQRHIVKAWAKNPPANAYGGDWPERRRLVLARDGHVCQLRFADICVGRASEVDHIAQVAGGGSNDLSNLRAACKPCHARRTGRQGALAQQLNQRKES